MTSRAPNQNAIIREVCRRYQISPTVPMETTTFFNELVKAYDGSSNAESFEAWLSTQCQAHFTAVGERPRWIQSPEWPFIGLTPMSFIGQIDVDVAGAKKANLSVHDDTSFYVFASTDGEIRVIVQQY